MTQFQIIFLRTLVFVAICNLLDFRLILLNEKNVLQVTDVSQRNSSSGTSGSASSPSSGVSSQLTGNHQQQQHTAGQSNNSNSQAALAAQLVSQQLLMHGSLGALGPQEIQALASTFQQQQQSLQQQLQQLAMFQQANSAAAGQLPAQAQFFLQNQVRENFH